VFSPSSIDFHTQVRFFRGV